MLGGAHDWKFVIRLDTINNFYKKLVRAIHSLIVCCEWREDGDEDEEMLINHYIDFTYRHYQSHYYYYYYYGVIVVALNIKATGFLSSSSTPGR